MELESARLNLQQVSMDDLAYIHDLHLREETDRYNTLGIPKDLSETRAVVRGYLEGNQGKERRFYTFSLFLKSNRDFVGLVSLNTGKAHYRNADVWYKIHPDHWGKGLATEALQTLLNFGFKELNLHRIEAGSAVDNVSSIRVLEKVGMKLEGIKRKNLPLKSGWSDNFEYAILDSDWEQHRQP